MEVAKSINSNQRMNEMFNRMGLDNSELRRENKLVTFETISKTIKYIYDLKGKPFIIAQEVEKFLNFILTDEEAVRRLGVERGVPSNQVAYEILEENNELLSLEYDGHQEVQKLYNANNTVDLYIHPYYEDDTFRQVYELEFDAWLLGNKTSQQVVTNLVKNFNNALNGAMN
jgi:ABC-type glycerol-3-phosphate transport system substrate-binding protein